MGCTGLKASSAHPPQVVFDHTCTRSRSRSTGSKSTHASIITGGDTTCSFTKTHSSGPFTLQQLERAGSKQSARRSGSSLTQSTSGHLSHPSSSATMSTQYLTPGVSSRSLHTSAFALAASEANQLAEECLASEFESQFHDFRTKVESSPEWLEDVVGKARSKWQFGDTGGVRHISVLV
mmetsp:Transcript_51052/g.119455  ORF Transcript_51052/g.119455 Transcript_51052/m.119455 type:complete len:179 (+) Transcript_51052:120-656(+)